MPRRLQTSRGSFLAVCTCIARGVLRPDKKARVRTGATMTIDATLYYALGVCVMSERCAVLSKPTRRHQKQKGRECSARSLVPPSYGRGCMPIRLAPPRSGHLCIFALHSLGGLLVLFCVDFNSHVSRYFCVGFGRSLWWSALWVDSSRTDTWQMASLCRQTQARFVKN